MLHAVVVIVAVLVLVVCGDGGDDTAYDNEGARVEIIFTFLRSLVWASSETRNNVTVEFIDRKWKF